VYQTVELTFAAETVKSNIHLYEDAGCVVPFSFAPNPQAKGTYVIGEEVTSSQGVTAYSLDTHLTERDSPFLEYGYTIFGIEGDRLYLGEDAETPAERPTELNFDEFFIRQ
jgi:hypothetical protein